MEAIKMTLALVVLSWFLYRYLKKREAERDSAAGKVIPGPVGYPLVGSSLELTRDNIYDKFSDYARSFGDIFQIQIVQTKNVVINSAELVHKALLGDNYKHVFNNRPSLFLTDNVYNGGMSITFYKKVDDKVHTNFRKAFAKSLHIYGDGAMRFEENVKSELRRFVNEIESFGDEEFDVMSLISSSLANVISILLIGEPADKTDRDDFLTIVAHQDFFLGTISNSVLSSFPFLKYTPGVYKTRYDEFIAIKQRIIERFFIQSRATRQPGVIRGVADWYLEHQDNDIKNGKEPFMTDEKIYLNLMEVIITGMITSSSVLSSTLLCLLNHPEYQAKIQEELDSIVGEDNEPSLMDKHGCPFTEAVLMETQRYLTPLPILLPHVASKDVTFEGFSIKKDTMIFPNAWHIHHDEKVWGDPWTYRPERFLDEHGELLPKSHPNRKSWLSFGIGKRQCPGEALARSRLFLYLTTLLKRFTLIPSKSGCPSCDPRKDSFNRNMTLRPKPFYCRAVKIGGGTDGQTN